MDQTDPRSPAQNSKQNAHQGASHDAPNEARHSADRAGSVAYPTDPDRLLPDPLPADPVAIFKDWFDQAHRLPVGPNPNAMTLATIDPDGRPSARIVLCKSIDTARGHITFYTNYRGRKGQALEISPRAAVVFHWDALDRQVRLEGPVVRSPREESDAYFASRPWPSRIGAWASQQSQPVQARAELLEQVDAVMRRFGLDPARPPRPGEDVQIPRPPHWGGFRVWFERIELWLGGPGRLHERAAWTRALQPGTALGDFAGTPWQGTRLQP